MDTKFSYKINVTYWNDELTDKFILVPISLDEDVKDQLNSMWFSILSCNSI